MRQRESERGKLTSLEPEALWIAVGSFICWRRVGKGAGRAN